LISKLQNHPAVIVVTLLGTILGLITTPIAYWQGKQDAKVIQGISSSVTQIRAEVGGQTTVIDVASVTVPESQVANKTSKRTLYFRDVNCYALPASALTPQWSTARTSEWGFDRASLGKAVEGFPPKFISTLKSIPLYIWARPTIVEVGPLHIQPQIILERFSLTDATALLTPPQPGQDKAAEARQKAATRADPTGSLLLSQMNLISAFGVDVKLTTIDKQGDVVYAQFDAILPKVTVNGQHRQGYYLTIQLVIVTTPDGIYVVKTYLPRSQPRSIDTPIVNRWLKDFHPVV
jgi:hypothetical protein